MLKTITELVVRIADLAEAEGRQLRAIVAKMSFGFASLAIGAVFVVLALVLLLFALFEWIKGPLGVPAAAAIIAGLCLVVAGVALWHASKSLSNQGKGG